MDATKSGRIGRLINHSLNQPNLVTKLFAVDGQPRLGFVAKQDIEAGTELLYDYGSAYWDSETPLLGRAVHAALPKNSLAYKVHARVNPRRAVIDLF